MIHDNESVNSHIDEYLDYYCELTHAPGFAVLLKGPWGAGKTWYINKYRENFKEANQQFIYVSLYGMTNSSEIENMFFQQLQPFWSSKEMATIGKLSKALIKFAIRVDFDFNGDPETTLNPQIPDIEIFDRLKNLEKCILIFDDLERCKIEIGSLMGYINYFVEQKDMKVIIIADEDKLINLDASYRDVKEKLIGRSFEVSSDLHSALENFIKKIDSLHLQKILSDNINLIQDCYKKTKYKNLRNLKQALFDFERIFKVLPEKVKSNSELLQYFLKLLIAFSAEIRQGMAPQDITRLVNEYASGVVKKTISPQALSSEIKDSSTEQTPLQKILEKYKTLELHSPFPDDTWWETFFDKGIIDIPRLEHLLPSSKHFQNENRPNWIKLWYYTKLTDDEFVNVLQQVESEYDNRNFVELGIIKHITGIFLSLSDVGLYSKSKNEILKNAKAYIDWMKDNNQLNSTLAFREYRRVEQASNHYDGLGFQGREFREFSDFCLYIAEVQERISVESMPSAGQELLAIMRNDVWKFYRMICLLDDYLILDDLDQRYYNVPILKYIEASTFVENILHMEFDDLQCVFWALEKRYQFDNVNTEKLFEELSWLKDVRDLLLKEAIRRKGKLSGHILNEQVQGYLNKVVEKLERKEPQA